MSVCENVTNQARETFAALVQGNWVDLSQGCSPQFRKYEFRGGVLASATGETFVTPVADGVDGDHLSLTTNDSSQEVLLDIVIGDAVKAAKLGFGALRWGNQLYPKIVGGAGSSLATNTEQGAFLTPESREGGVRGLNVSCYRPFSQLSPLMLGLKEYSAALVTGISFQIITARLDNAQARWAGPEMGGGRG